MSSKVKNPMPPPNKRPPPPPFPDKESVILYDHNGRPLNPKYHGYKANPPSPSKPPECRRVIDGMTADAIEIKTSGLEYFLYGFFSGLFSLGILATLFLELPF